MWKGDRGVLRQKAVFLGVCPRKKGVSVVKFLQGYYPFGLTFNEWTNTSPENNYLFNQGTGDDSFATERQDELDVDMTRYRVYDYNLGRFWQTDPLADAYPQESWSPYQYAYNNPIIYNDPDGDCPWCLVPLGVFIITTFGAEDAVAPTQDPVRDAAGRARSAKFRNLAREVGVTLISIPLYTGGEDETPVNEPGDTDGNSDPYDENGPTVENANELEQQKEGYDYYCEECNKDIRKPDQSKKGVPTPTDVGNVDHKYPRSEGGDGDDGNDQILCSPCNNDKRDQLPIDRYGRERGSKGGSRSGKNFTPRGRDRAYEKNANKKKNGRPLNPPIKKTNGT